MFEKFGMTYLLFDFPKKLIRVKTGPQIIVMLSYALQYFPHWVFTDLESFVFILPRFITHCIFIIESCFKIRIHI